jgi:hypothetical protein
MVDALPAPAPRLDNKTFSQQSAAAAAASISESSRDVHELPEFSPLKPLTSPILYLPPLLSSLPDGMDVPRPSVENPPMTTDTRLPDIDPVSLSLHKALHHFRPLSSAYATTPYAEAFNWANLQLPEDEEREWYCVAFRSKRKPGSDSGRKYYFSSSKHLGLLFVSSSLRRRSPCTRRGGPERRGECYRTDIF